MSDIEKVIENGYCVGCGACSYVEPDVYKIKLSENGQKTAVKSLDAIDGQSSSLADKVCPFSSSSSNESEISSNLFGEQGFSYDKVLGHYNTLFAGHVIEGQYRENGSSGGMVSWLINELFIKDQIDYVVHVKEKDSNDLFSYSVSSSSQEALTASKSKYYPISMDGVLTKIRENHGRYLFVGIPCFIKALRNVSLQDEIIKKRIKFTAGLVCGHLKSTFFSYNYAMQVGVHPEDLSQIDFRHKESTYNGPANQYFIKVKDKHGNIKIKQNIDFYGYLWGHGFFKYKACDYCDDIFAETADICLGDAWISPYVDDPAGDNILIIRNSFLTTLFDEAKYSGRIKLDSISKDDVKKSQEAGIRHRRDGVNSRVKFKKIIGKWYPKKRYVNESYLGRSGVMQNSIYIYREYVSRKSMDYFKEALTSNDYDVFKRKMKVIMFIYNRILYFSFSKYYRKILAWLAK